jgi:hypothetical protein
LALPKSVGQLEIAPNTCRLGLESSDASALVSQHRLQPGAVPTQEGALLLQKSDLLGMSDAGQEAEDGKNQAKRSHQWSKVYHGGEPSQKQYACHAEVLPGWPEVVAYQGDPGGQPTTRPQISEV